MEEDWLDKLKDAPMVVTDAFQKADTIINKPQYEAGKIICSISSGADSDIMMDLLTKVDRDHKVRYVFFNTGVEYRATLEHLDELEKRYNVTIERRRPQKAIPVCVKEYGVPVISKAVAEHMERLQRHGFQWEDQPFDELYNKYPGCKSSLKWWCNVYPVADGFNTYMLNINRNKHLKEYIMEHPPTFSVSAKCCDYTKKKIAHQVNQEYDAQLDVIGVHRAEGGQRAKAYKNCFGYSAKHELDRYRPLFWFTDADKAWYENAFGIVHSECYTKYGFKRTGCAGCPFNRNVLSELGTVKDYEPNMYTAAQSVFGQAYEWTKGYREYCELKENGFIQEKMF